METIQKLGEVCGAEDILAILHEELSQARRHAEFEASEPLVKKGLVSPRFTDEERAQLLAHD